MDGVAEAVECVEEGIFRIQGESGAFVCILFAQARGCAFGDDMVARWRQVESCQHRMAPQGYRNTYAQLKPEPDNKFDKNAIEVLARGEFFGHMGYIAKEQTERIRRLSELTDTDIRDLDVFVADGDDIGWKNVRILVCASGSAE